MNKTSRRSRSSYTKLALIFLIGLVFSLIPIFKTFADASIFKVTGAEITSISAEATADIVSFNDSTVFSKVTFHHINDEASYKIKILNSSSKDYTISAITDDNTNPYISYIYDAHNGLVVPAGTSFDFEVVAKYTTGVTDMNERVSTSTVKFFINFVGEEDAEEIDINPVVPNTGANHISDKGGALSINLVVLAFCTLGLVVCAILAIRRHSKSSRIILAIAIAASIVTIPTAVSAIVTEINVFSITTEYHLMDKLIVHHGDEDTIINYGTPLEDADIDEPEKPGHTFTGWEDEEGNLIDPAKPIREDTTIIPRFAAKQYTITFDTAGGSEIAPISLDYGETVNAPADPTRTGYTFAGWTPEIPTTMPAENITITAQWTVNQYTITFDTAGGSEVTPITQDYNTEVTAPANPTRTGYTFAGWNPEVPSTMPAENITVTAQWTVNQYTITFDTDGGSTIAPITQDYNTGVAAPANPTKAGYTFAGWTPEIPETMPAENITVTAQWTINQYTITFDTAGGNEIAPITQNYGTDVTAPTNPTRTGYTFAGWTPEIPTTMPAENMTVVAQWDVNQYTITFDTVGGSEVAPITQDYGTNVTAPANPTRTGYTFAGWTPEIPATMPAENITITANWTRTPYTIIFNKNAENATGTMESQDAPHGETVNLIPNAFTRDLCEFNGWNTAPDGSGTAYADEASVIDLTAGDDIILYAQWKGYINYLPNAPDVEGTMGRQSASDNSDIMLLASNFSRANYGFAGWNTKPDYSGSFYGPQEDITVPAGTATNGLGLYAVWVESAGSFQNSAEVTSVCGSLVAAPTDGTADLRSVSALTDQRDNETYAIAKLSDGRCWMIENLRLESTADHNSDGSLAQGYGTSATYGNFAGLADAEIASRFRMVYYANSLYSNDGSNNTINIGAGDSPALRMPRYNNVNTSLDAANRPQNPTSNSAINGKTGATMYSYGNYYSWPAAVADVAAHSTNNQSISTTICPSGWRLPRAGDKSNEANNESWSLIVKGINGGVKPANYGNNATPHYTGSTEGTAASKATRAYPNNFVFSGMIDGGTLNYYGKNGYYWTSTAMNSMSSYTMNIHVNAVYPGTISAYRYMGRSVRCIADF